MIALHVRDILDMPKDEIWSIPDDEMLCLTFDDDETIEVPVRQTITSSYYWQVFKEWPGGKITKRHHLLDKELTSGTHEKMATKVFWDAFFGYCPKYLCGEGQTIVWEMSRFIWELTNEMYNDHLSMLGQFVTTLDIEDLVDIILHPDISAIKELYRQGEIGINEEHDRIYEMVRDHHDFIDNPISRGIRSGMINKNSVKQVIGERAFVPDINGVTSETPIQQSYLEGLHTTFDRMVESRSASIALYMATAPLESSEYNNRMCQFLCMPIRGVHYGDCGGKHTIPWLVLEDDLPKLRGKVYMKDGKPEVIWGHEEELVGKTINIRSITTCDHHDPTTPCSVCIGLNALTVPPGANLGYHLSTDLLTRISQLLLSFKHFLASTKPSIMEICGAASTWLMHDKENQALVHFTRRVAKETVSLRFPRDDAVFINNLHHVDNPHAISPESFSCVTAIQIVVYSKSKMIKETIDISTTVGGKGSPLSSDFLTYMKETSWEVVGESIEVDLSKWNISLPFMLTPRRGEDVMEVLTIAENFVHAPKGKIAAVRAVDFKHPGPAIRGFMDELSSKITVNFSHVEIFTRALMAKGETSYALPRGEEPFRFIRLREAIKCRGLGAAFAFEGQKDYLCRPETYLRHLDDIDGTPLDYLVD